MPLCRYIKFLCELCVCDGQGILKNQSIICKRLLEENSTLLLTLALDQGAVYVHVPVDEDSMARSSSHSESFTGRVRRSGWRKSSSRKMQEQKKINLLSFYQSANARMTSFFEQSLDLFAKLCVGGNMRTWDVVSRFVSREILVTVLGLDTGHLQSHPSASAPDAALTAVRQCRACSRACACASALACACADALWQCSVPVCLCMPVPSCLLCPIPPTLATRLSG